MERLNLKRAPLVEDLLERIKYMGCFENYMEFREEVDKIKKERTHKVAPQSPDDISNIAEGSWI